MAGELGAMAMRACVLDVLAPKPGNVHLQEDFEDVTWVEFVTSAVVCGPMLDRAGELGVGPTVLACVRATRQAVGGNTNLGLILLLAPLCAASDVDDVSRVLASLNDDDAKAIYEAIAHARPGGLGRVERGDVMSGAPPGVIEAMTLAAGRDAVARQYANGFADVLNVIAPEMAADYALGMTLDDAIVLAHVKQMAREPDSLIARKVGRDIAEKSQKLAAKVLTGEMSVVALDDWLRAEGHRRNPGTSADLVVAALFANFRRGRIQEPFRWGQTISCPA